MEEQEPPGAGFLLARHIQVAAPDQLSRPIPARTGFCDAGRVICTALMTAFVGPAAASQRPTPLIHILPESRARGSAARTSVVYGKRLRVAVHTGVSITSKKQ